jgi:repressor LexA
MENLTPKQQQVYDFIRAYFADHGTAPSYHEVRDGLGLRAVSTVAKHLKYLESKGALSSPWKNGKRVLKLTGVAGPAVTLPLLGTVAAGDPIEALEVPEEIEVPQSLLRAGDCFALRVRGDSMIEDGIHDGDIILVKRQPTAENGQTVVAIVDNDEATVKRFHRRGNTVELRPANAAMKPMKFEASRIQIRGVLIGLLRKYQ